MAKLLVLLFAVLLVVTLAEACSPKGGLCMQNEECCPGMLCHSIARRCIVGPWGPMSNGNGRPLPPWKWQWQQAALPPNDNNDGNAAWNWPGY